MENVSKTQPTDSRCASAPAFTELPPQVRAIVRHLASHRRKIVSPDELREVGWSGSNRPPKRLAHYIAQARRYLGDSAREPNYIRTVYGEGYQFIGPSEFAASQFSPGN